MSTILVKPQEIRCEKCGQIVPIPEDLEGQTVTVEAFMMAIDTATNAHQCPEASGG